MFKRSIYATFCFCLVGLGGGLMGCGSSSQQRCPPAISGKAAGNITGERARAEGKSPANATANAPTTGPVNAPPTDVELREAAELRARAQAHIDAGRWREALPDLERAFALSKDVTILGDLGLALDGVERFEESWIALYRFRAEAQAAHEPMRAKIDAKLGELQTKLGGLVIDTDTPGAEVIVRGQVVARLPLVTPIFLAPGDAAVVVRAPGKPELTVRSRVAVGEIARASANLAAVGKRPSGPVVGVPGEPFIPPPPPAVPIAPFVVIGGSAVVIGGAAAAVIYSGKAEQFDLNHCGKADAKPVCKSLDTDANTAMLKITGGLLGGALVTGLVAYLIMRPKTPDLKCPEVGKAAPLQLRCGVGADGTTAGLGCVGAF